MAEWIMEIWDWQGFKDLEIDGDDYANMKLSIIQSECDQICFNVWGFNSHKILWIEISLR
jgi:hypothetical protein